MHDSNPSYLGDFLQSPGNVVGVLGGLAAGVLLSFPYGLLGAAIPLLVTAGAEIIACLFVPDMPSFRHWADKQRTDGGRAETEAQMLEEIRRRCPSPSVQRKYFDAHQSIVRQVEGLQTLAAKRPGALGLEDRDRIAAVPSEFLGLNLSLLVMDDRTQAVDLGNINRKLAQITRQLAEPADGADVRELERARDEYTALLARHQRMLSRRAAIEAAIVSLPDQLAEIYQMVMSDGTQSQGAQLTDAIANLRLRQDIDAELAADLSGAIEDVRTKQRGNADGLRSAR